MQQPNLKIVGKMDLPVLEKKEKINVQNHHHVSSNEEKIIHQEIVHFFQGDKNRIIGKLKNGKVAIIDRRARKGLVSDNEDWLVEIVRDEENICFVMPLEMVSDSKDNSIKIKDKAQGLQNNNWKVGKL